MAGNAKLLRDRLNREKGERDRVKRTIEAAEKKLVQIGVDIENIMKAQAIAQAVAKATQQQIEVQISSIVSLALSSVFPDPYEFKAVFVTRRSKTECDLLFTKDGMDIDPMTAAGGGVLDVASFALRVALWSLKKTQNVQILDEPFKFVSRDLQPRISSMLKTFSEKLKVQFVIVSHIPEIIDHADKVFIVDNGEVGVDGLSE